MRRKLLIALGAVVVLAAAGVGYFLHRFPLNEPVVHADPAMHFKHGSIGGDTDNGLPKRIMEVLPEVFGDLLPAGAPKGYAAFGFVVEPGEVIPVGFSERTKLVPLLGMNCGTCHMGYYRTSPAAEPVIIPAMGSTTLDLMAFFGFLFRAAEDPRFSPDGLFPAMEKRAPMDWLDKLVYRRVIKEFKAGLAKRKTQLGGLFNPKNPFGPGRVDTFNPYKLSQLGHEYPNGLTPEEAIGIARYPSIWEQKSKRTRPLNWDGNAPRVQDRNVGAAFGAGATPESLDLAAIARVQAYLEDLQPPKWPFTAPDPAAVARGATLYKQYCYSCHDPAGDQIGKLVPIEQIGTDRRRLDSYTEKLNTLFQNMGPGEPWQMKGMQKTNGYANRPLDGIWARGPYLHNGSVPTLADLLRPAAERNGGAPTFKVGHAVYDPVNVGLRTDVAAIGGWATPDFDLRLPGNSNAGHTGAAYGTDLPPEDKQALLAYLKTL